MNSLNEFFYMGGYGQYVWGAYGITALAMILSIASAFRQHKKLRAQLKRQLKRQLQGQKK